MTAGGPGQPHPLAPTWAEGDCPCTPCVEDLDQRDPRKLDADIALGVWQNGRAAHRCDVDGTSGNPRPCTHRECWDCDDDDEPSAGGTSGHGTPADTAKPNLPRHIPLAETLAENLDDSGRMARSFLAAMRELDACRTERDRWRTAAKAWEAPFVREQKRAEAAEADRDEWKRLAAVNGALYRSAERDVTASMDVAGEPRCPTCLARVWPVAPPAATERDPNCGLCHGHSPTSHCTGQEAPPT